MSDAIAAPRQHQLELLASDPEAMPRHPAPLTIGVISDTHINGKGGRTLPSEPVQLFRRFGVGLILHAGDVNDVSVLDELAELAPVLAVKGNNDNALLQRSLPLWLHFIAGNTRVALVHGHGGRSAKTVAVKQFAGLYDLVVYGHSHHPDLDQVQGTLFFNPGSPTDRGRAEHFGIGLIRVTEEAAEPELILFKQLSELDAIQP